jgi:hypothetical protein
LKLYAIGQRRGPKVHIFLSAFGSFVKEIPSRFKHVESFEAAPWTTVSILNKVTQAQPMIDAFNRQLFDLLGMQYSFPTRCFETRFAQHFMLPNTYVNAVNASLYFMPQQYKDVQTKGMLMLLATQMTKNAAWLEMRNSPSVGPGGGGNNCSRSGKRYNPAEKTWHQVSIDGGPPSRESPAKHVLILLSQLEGYKGSKQQRCWECNKLVSWCCARCSSAASWVPLHPAVTQGSKKQFCCLAAHRANPAGGYKVSHECLSGTSRASKRRRQIPFAVL